MKLYTTDKWDLFHVCKDLEINVIYHINNVKKRNHIALSVDWKKSIWQNLTAIHNKPGEFPHGSDGKESAYNVGDLGLIPGLGRSSEGGNGNPLQYSCPENSMDRGAWWAAVYPWSHKESDVTELKQYFYSSIKQ